QWTQTTRAAERFAELLAAAVALAWLATQVPRAVAGSLVVALLAIDLFVFADGFHPLVPREYQFPSVPEIDLVKKDTSVFRVVGWGDTLLANTAMVYGLQDVRVYDGIGVGRYAELLDVGFHFTGLTHQLVSAGALPLLDLLNVKYVFAPRDA